ncbi:MAG: primosomal protein N' [bacterium]|nr:primosomal protein N' [bacterium]
MNKFADIVALTNGDPKKSVFTYGMPEFEAADLIQVGSLVSVPYGKKEIRGVVIALHDSIPSFPTRPISELIYETPVITSQLIDTARWMSEYYHEPLRNCIETVMIFKKKVRIPKAKIQKKMEIARNPVILNTEQQTAFDQILTSINTHTTFLLHGITGSGKTEIYLQVMDAVIKQGKQVIYLVPEIALTPQTIKRVEERFPGKTSVLNSQVSDGERYAAFLGSITGEKPIVIGSRSALFTPFPRIGLIIIDEEHDHSLKQESSPRYNAVQTAKHMAEELKIPLILGSATPRVEDFYLSRESSTVQLLTLTERAMNAFLPKVTIVDMRVELKKRNFSTLSDDLESALALALEKGEQSLLFLNKRGVASSLMCRMCGWTAECPRCSIALTLHKEYASGLSNMLVCHHCDYQNKMIFQCPDCESLYIKPLGSGTERVEQDILKVFPKARILRMDRDTTTAKGSHEKIYLSFLNHEADILIGTQMITKGWDIPNVTLVGIVNADTALHMPSYSAAENSFSLITQVAGRAGRAQKQGTVVLQSYTPEHYAVTAAAMHDYADFYTKEIGFRKSLMYPPFSQLAQLVYCDEKQEKAEYKAEVLFKKLESTAKELQNIEVLGPTTGIIPRLRNKWYYQILLKGDKKSIDLLIETVPPDWTIDVDPISA